MKSAAGNKQLKHRRRLAENSEGPGNAFKDSRGQNTIARSGTLESGPSALGPHKVGVHELKPTTI